MPYSFTQIEKDKTRTIGLVFSFLIFLYFIAAWCIYILIKNYQLWGENHTPEVYSVSLPSIFENVAILFTAASIGIIHWLFSVDSITIKILDLLQAEDLDPQYSYHQMFRNILDEVGVATGGLKIRGVVIPTMAMNAFAIVDYKGDAIIGVTEGMLARLSRAQLEAVVGHEAAHVVSGDCLATTIVTSLFAIYSGMLVGLQNVFGAGRYGSRKGGGAGLLLLIYLVLSFIKFSSFLVKMFITRSREYRADAVAVRLTRDPLALAGALYAITRRWRDSNMASVELESIFIVNPQYAPMDEAENIFANLFSTHPPVEQRIQILLDMAHADVNILVKEVENLENRPRGEVPQPAASMQRWMVNQGGTWQGPFSLPQIAGLNAFRPDTWIRGVNEDKVKMALEDQALKNLFNHGSKEGGSFHCPHCRCLLSSFFYEGVEAYKCLYCFGTLVNEADVQKIIIRQEVGFSTDVLHQAEIIKKEDDIRVIAQPRMDPRYLLVCPRCEEKRQMLKRFYTEAYPVEVDSCIYCGSLWFDKDELEILQYMIEERTRPKE